MTARSIKAERIAYQIWALIQRTGGDCTLHDMAEATGESWQTCRAISGSRGWTTHYRKITTDIEFREVDAA
ncbi:hypothetical protein C4N9_20795 [Pararhodobacter marinus]|uniref:Helix-turn-helix domain-containing protein n=1 Tax=Pararhodobacter marinus TaxID=2184063 RepID=A0A2U2C4D3_9RHOB|nr:hypothetical protein [Pararhodobacter marinus]PWE26701.1 hypothetical protein C4N9_20795 [Pararhodobacter marinus]